MFGDEPTASHFDDTLPPPERIGPYRLFEELGHGGMGTVYLAEQTEPVRRRVALKLIKLGMDTREVIARFEAERQALALMNHPNVAAVLDAGATDHGRPYFVMEYVPGEPITAYCDKHQLSLPERLKLFIQVCHAIQHAHQKGVIHRDIKPGNVLVMLQDGQPTPKVIDFGVAKATNQRLTEQTIFTERGVLIGTPEYMSPEQAEMTTLDIDTRTDVYSLGVLLYELLTGALPFDSKTLRSAGFAAIQRIIREVEPPKPSTKFSGLMMTADDDTGSLAAEKRRLDPRTLTRRLRGDLDWITMKALEKDRTRRYGSASDLAADVRRHLDHEPVIAGPPSVGYRIRKFVRRNRTTVVAGMVILVALVLGIVGTGVGMTWALQERDHAEQERIRAQTVTSFLETVLTAPEQRGYDVTVAEVLAAAEGRLQELEGNPDIQAEVLRIMGTALESVGLYADACKHLQRARSIHMAAGNDQGVAVIDTALGAIIMEQGSPKEAEVMLRASVEVLKSVEDEHWDDLILALNNHGQCLWKLKDYVGAEQCSLEALQLIRSHADHQHAQFGIALGSMGSVYYSRGQLEKAIEQYAQALPALRASWGHSHKHTLTALNNLAFLYGERGKLGEADGLYEDAIARAREHLGDSHPVVATILGFYGANLGNRLRWSEAEPLLRESHEIRRARFGRLHPATIEVAYDLVKVLSELRKDLDEAEQLARLVLDDRESRHGEESRAAVGPLYYLNRILQASQRRTDEAERLLWREVEIRTKLDGEAHGYTLGAMQRLASLLVNRGKLDEGAAVFEKGLTAAE